MGVRSPIRPGKNASAASESFLAEIDACWTALATRLAQSGTATLAQQAERLSRQFVELALFLQLCQARQVLEPAAIPADAGESCRDLAKWAAAASQQIGAALVCPGDLNLSALPGDDPSVAGVLARLTAPAIADHLTTAPPEILGWTHHRLLEWRLAGVHGKRTVETARAAKKTRGAFYTPEYVVRYMVGQAVGKQLLQDEQRQAFGECMLRILDPACGCGFFLLGACRFLREWCDRHGIHGCQRWIAHSLHGTDVDDEAVLAARRSLWLELAGSGPPRPGRSISAEMAGEVRDELTSRVRCGDALVDAAWPEGPGRFDVVIGNPPYRRELNAKHLLAPLASTRWGQRHRAPRMDLWYYFVHRGLELLRTGARLSFIVDSYWTSSRGAAKLISALQEDAWIEEIFSLGRAHVFDGVSGRHMILSLVKGPKPAATTIKRAATADDAEAILAGRTPVDVFQKTSGQLFRAGRLDLEPPADELLARLARWPCLKTLGAVRQGIVENPASVAAKTNRQHGDRWRPGEGVFALTDAETASLKLPETESRLLRAYHDLGDLARYFLADAPSRWLIYSTAESCPQIDEFPALHAHLARFRPIMERRRETRLGLRPWWQLHWPRDERVWKASKLISLQMAWRPAFVAAAAPVYVPFSVNVFVPHPDTREHLDYLAALLNSRLLWKWFSHHAKQRGVGLEINGHVLAETPIRTIDFHLASDRAAHDRLARLGREMTQATACLRAAESNREKAAIDRRLTETDRQIDLAVYSLYGLTEAEIASVESAELTR